MAVIGTNNILKHHRLSIRIHAGGFSFIIADATTGEVWRRSDFSVGDSENMASVLQDALGQVAGHSQTFESVDVIANTPSTRIPLEEFRRDELVALYRVVFPNFDLKKMDICYTIQPQLETAEIFSIQQDVRALVTQAFPIVNFENVCGIALERMMKHHRRTMSNVGSLYAHFADNILLLCSIDGDRLVFANTFDVPNIADALYFTLYTWKTLELDALKDCLYLSGHADTVAAFRNEARKYVRDIELLDEIGMLID